MRNVLITGASRGIGRACALMFAKKNYNVVINYINSKEKAEKMVNLILSEGGKAMAIKADIAVKSEVNEMFREAEKTFGGIDILVNNAGISQQKIFSDVTEDEWDRMFDINVKGQYNCIQAALPYMIHEKHGRIINFSSIWGMTGASCEVHYSASKAAVIGLTKALAKELGPSGITVNCVAPGVINTEMNKNITPEVMNELKEDTPLMMIGEPCDIAETVMFLASEKARFITGQVISPNGGFFI